MDMNEMFLEMLRGGEDINALAERIGNALNEAKDTYKNEEQAKREAEMKAKAEATAKRRSSMINAMTCIIEDIVNYIDVYYPELSAHELNDENMSETAGELVDAIDGLADEAIKALNAIGVKTNVKPKSEVEDKKTVKVLSPKDSEVAELLEMLKDLIPADAEIEGIYRLEKPEASQKKDAIPPRAQSADPIKDFLKKNNLL